MEESTNGKAPAPPSEVSKAQLIRDYFQANPKADDGEVLQALKNQGIETTLGYVST